MFGNHLKIAIRNLFRNQTSAFINIGGLALGMAVAALIGLWIWDEVSYNKYHDNYDHLAQVKRMVKHPENGFVSDYQVSALGDHLRTTYGHFFEHVAMARRIEEWILTADNLNFTQKGSFMQPAAPKMFSLRMITGNHSGLADMNSILLSESVAKKLFDDVDIVGETVQIDSRVAVQVTGVYEDLPHNSAFRDASFIAPLDLFFSMTEQDGNAWSNQNMSIYTQLHSDIDIQEVNAAIKDDYAIKAEKTSDDYPPELFLHPMKEWHLYSEFENGHNVASNQLKFVWFNGVIGLFVLLLACINFMNLSTARSEKRAKEVGIRKTIGSLRVQLIQQFFSESILIAVLACIGALIIVQFSMPWFNGIADKNLHIPWAAPSFWIAGIAFTLFTGILAGSYPAFYLSSFKPVKALSGKLGVGRPTITPRKTLVVFQFVVSIALIIGTLIVHQQLKYAKNRPVGYSQEGLLMLPKRVDAFYGKANILKNELQKTGVVVHVGQSNYPLTNTFGNNDGFSWAGKDPGFDPTFNTIRVNHDYGKTIGWELVAGRDFSEDFGTDKTGVIINESALRIMNLQNPIGEKLTFSRDYFGGPEFTILGVVKDMIKGSPFDEAFPAIMFLSERELYWLFIRMDPRSSVAEALPKIKTAIQAVIPTAPFDYKFVDEEYAAKFKAEERIGSLASIFALLAILISCLGLFGLAIYVAEQRTKEIGIRKILGASVGNIVRLLSIDFIKLVLVAILLAVPFAWYVANQWLQNYTYRIDLPWQIFVLAGFTAIAIALLTIGFQSIRAALANPVESLRSE